MLHFLLHLLPALALASGAAAKNGADVKNVAIIGAGAAGSSAAYHLRQYAAAHHLAINMTLFEKTNHIGGRTLTVQPYDDPHQPAIEVGASIFVAINHILYNASRDFGLDLTTMSIAEPGDITAIWDGQAFVFQSTNDSPWWWDVARLWWRYGLAPYKALRLVRRVVSSFLALYDAPVFPFRSLNAAVQQLGLDRVTGVTGEQFLADNKITGDFGNHIIQAATRVNYASNLAYIHGLETMVSFSTDDALAIDGGNWRIFSEMVRRSGATVHRNTSVASIASSSDKKLVLTTSSNSDMDPVSTRNTNPSPNPDTNQDFTRDTIPTSPSDSNPDSTPDTKYPTPFDAVIVASPWQFSNIKAADDLLPHPIDSIPYTKLHVTLFATPLKLSPTFFNLDPSAKPPTNVYTTLGKAEPPQAGAPGVGRTGFYSISTLRAVTNPSTRRREYVYKIFSAEPVTSDFLSAILGHRVPDNLSTNNHGHDNPSTEIKHGSENPSANTAHGPISWFYPRYFYSYPIELPRVTFQDPVIAQGIYYTSGIESFISTMETSALMGKNVARLIADDFVAQDFSPPHGQHINGLDDMAIPITMGEL